WLEDGERSGHAAGIAEIGRDGDRAVTEFGREGLEPLLPASEHHDRRAFLDESLRDTAPGSAARAGDDRDLAVEHSHGVLLSVSCGQQVTVAPWSCASPPSRKSSVGITVVAMAAPAPGWKMFIRTPCMNHAPAAARDHATV